MKQRTFNILCLMIATLSGVGMFLLKYHVAEQEKKLELLRRQIIDDKRELHLLQADWAVLTDPQHMRELIKETNLKPMQAKQIVSPKELENRLPHSSGEKDV
ncbi:MAG: hypothetical protein J6T55_03500 [Alphaproteobacteria bacterium]|nr:hypothetical protein [Alphaproteobacteria bacterium]